MRESMQDPMRRQLTSARRITAALLPGVPSPSTETSIPGHLCEVCLDAPAVAFVRAPWGGEMGVCAACAGLPPPVPAAPRAVADSGGGRGSTCKERAFPAPRGAAMAKEGRAP